MKNMKMVILFVGLFVFGCKDQVFKPDCVQGKYIGSYCEGSIIQILDDHTIGTDWKHMYNDKLYTNSVVASIDTLIAGGIDPNFFSVDSVFYFKYIEGGYPRKQYNLCEPSAFITITFVSKNNCLNEKEN